MSFSLEEFIGPQICDSSQLAGNTVVFLKSNYLPKIFTLEYLIDFLEAKKQNYRFVIIHRTPNESIISVGYRTSEYISSFATQLIIFCVQKQIRVQVHQSKLSSKQIVQWLKKNSLNIKKNSSDEIQVKFIDESKSKTELQMDAWNALGPSSWGPPIHVYRIIPTDIEAKLSLFQKVDYIPQYSPMKRFVTPRLNEMLGIPDVGEDVLQQIPNHRPFV